MAIQYTPRVFLRQVPKDLLKTYFERRKDLADFDWAALTDGEIDPLFEAWQALPDPKREEVESEFREVAELATHDGVRAIIEEGQFHQLDLAPELEAREGLHQKAFWVLLEHRVVFDVASQLNHADHLNGRYWRKRKDIPKKVPDVSAAARDALGQALSAYYREHQGRGERCKVECYLRAGKHHYFFAYPADYADTFIGYKPDGSFERRPQKPAFEVVFIYNPQDGTLDLYAQGDKDLKRDLQEIFSRIVLKEEIGPEAKNANPYELNGLKKRSFPFPTDSADGITEVRVKSLRLAVLGGRRRITLEGDARKNREDIYDLMDTALNEQRLPLSNVNVSHATIQMIFANNNGRPKTVTFNVSYPDSCNLRDKPEHLKAKEYLKRWGIARV